jgi:uncharacterized protein
MASHVVADQSAIFSFLADPATHRIRGPVKRIDTHGAAVFLAGPDVYKVKRAVRFAYMDFSTLDKREAACKAEIAANRDNAPGLYLGVLPIARDRGNLRLGGAGKVVEWVVHLRRFDEDATFDRLAERGPLGSAVIHPLAQVIVAAHRRAPIRNGRAATESLRGVLTETVDELAAPDIFPRFAVDALRSSLTKAFERSEALLLRRGLEGKVRRCHGDLHLRNVVLVNGEPVLFDAIEFDEAIATSDILYDLAFLIMDLCERKLSADANRLLNEYLWSCDDELQEIEGLALLPLFLSLRAAIRAKVTAAQLQLDADGTRMRQEAQAYLETAQRFLDPRSARLIAIGGLSGTGKSTLAAAIAPSLGLAPGALHVRSDIERKRGSAVAATQHLPAEGYRPEVSVQVYARLRVLAEVGLRAGRCVVLDATYRDQREREEVEGLATRLRVGFLGLWLEAPTDILTQRVAMRQGDVSDATAAVVSAQARQDVGQMTWQRLDAGVPLEPLKEAARELVAQALCQTTGELG